MPDLAIVILEDGTKQYQYIDSYEIMDSQINQQAANYNPLGATDTQGCANCNWFLAPGRCVVVAGPISPTGLSDLWRAEEADLTPPLLVQVVNPEDWPTATATATATKDVPVVADHPRTVPDYDPKDPKSAKRKRALAGHDAPTVVETFNSTDPKAGAKATLDAAKRNDLSSSDFAWTDSDGKGHLPINDKAHVKNAMSRWNQTHFATSSDKAAAKRKILAAARRYGIDASGFSGTKDTADWDVTDADGLSRATVADRLMSAIKSVLSPGSNADDIAGAHPVPAPREFTVVKQKDGRSRFFTAWSNNFIDREGEIFPETAHKEYIEWADRSQQYPELWLWHTKGTKYGQVDWLDYTDGFVFASGLIDAGFEDLAISLSKEDCGVSHGFHGLQRGKEIIAYRSFEISTLPRTNAAVWTTSFNILGEGAKEMAFTQQKKDWLKAHNLTDEQIAAAETQATNLSKALKDAGVAYKDADLVEEVVDDKAKAPPFGSEKADEAEDAADEKKKKAAAGKKEADTLELVAINSQKALDVLTALTTTIAGMETRLKAVEATDDSKIAATITGRGAAATGVAASKDASNVVTQDQTNKDAEFFGNVFLAGLGVGAGATGQ